MVVGGDGVSVSVVVVVVELVRWLVLLVVLLGLASVVFVHLFEVDTRRELLAFRIFLVCRELFKAMSFLLQD